MPAVTRKQSSAQTADEESQAFYRILGLFCDIKTDHPIRKVLEEDEITSVPDFVFLSDDYYCDIKYEETIKDESGNESTRVVPIKKVKVAHLLWLKCFLIKKAIDENNGLPLSADALNALTKASYDWFQTTQSEMPKLVMPTHQNPASASATPNTPAADFKKSIKRDVTHYPILKEI